MIVFDLDDTLYKEVHYIDSGIRAVAIDAEEAGVMSAQEAYDLIKNAPDTASGFDRLAAVALESDSYDLFDIQRMLAVYRYHVPELTLPEDSLKILDWLKSKGIPIGLITDGRSITQRAKIRALGLDNYIKSDNIMISEEVGSDKHWPTSFELIMKRNPSESSFTYIGDNPEKDFYWPNKLGWHTVMLLDTEHVNIHSQYLTGIKDSMYLPAKTISLLTEITWQDNSLKEYAGKRSLHHSHS